MSIRFPDAFSSARLFFRIPVSSDAARIFTRYASDPEVTRYLSWPTHREVADTEAFLSSAEDARQRRLGAVYLIEDAEGRLLGSTGLVVEAPHRLSTGYALARDAWGFGYATEALSAMIELAFADPAVFRLYALCDTEHHASAHVLGKAGLQEEGILRRHIVLPNLRPKPRDMRCFSKVR